MLVPEAGEVLAQVPSLSEEKVYPEVRALIDVVAAERSSAVKCSSTSPMVTYTGSRDITGRMDDILTRYGFCVAVMKADAAASDRREAWVADRVEDGIDVLICHQRLVQTGLDLIDFPTLVWFEAEFFVFQSTQKGAGLLGGRSEYN